MAELLEWVAADATVTDLTCSGWPLDGVSGRFAPPSVYSEVLVPDRPGAVLMNVRHDAREIDVPFMLTAADEITLRTRIRALSKLLDPKQGDGFLRNTAEDGTVRTMACQCISGPQLTELIYQNHVRQPTALQVYMLIFRARDPYWVDVAAQATTYPVGSASAFFPFFPLVLSPSTVSAAPTVTVLGDVKVWPVWTLTGPFSAVKIALGASVLRLEYAAVAGEVVTIDTRPGAKTVTSIKNFGGADTFTRPNSATTLGSSEGGALWVPHGGLFGISGNQAYLAAAAGSGESMALVPGAADIDVSVTLPTLSDQIGMAVRGADLLNHWRTRWSSAFGTYNLEKVVGGAVTSFGNTGFASSNPGDTLRIVTSGINVSLLLNGALKVTTGDAALSTQTGVGLFAVTVGAGRFDNFIGSFAPVVSNLYKSLTTAQMFPLQPGPNALTVVLVDGRAGSSVGLSYYNKWLAP